MHVWYVWGSIECRLILLCFVLLFYRGDPVEASYLEGREVASLQSAEQPNFALSLKDDLWVYVDAYFRLLYNFSVLWITC